MKKEKRLVWLKCLSHAHATSDAAHATSDMPISSPKPKPKKKKTAQDDKLDRKLARCTVQRFAGCSVPSNFTL